MLYLIGGFLTWLWTPLLKGLNLPHCWLLVLSMWAGTWEVHRSILFHCVILHCSIEPCTNTREWRNGGCRLVSYILYQSQCHGREPERVVEDAVGLNLWVSLQLALSRGYEVENSLNLSWSCKSTDWDDKVKRSMLIKHHRYCIGASYPCMYTNDLKAGKVYLGWRLNTSHFLVTFLLPSFMKFLVSLY